MRPADLAETLRLIAERPEAVLVAGCTDWGVEVNIRGVRAPLVVAIDRLPELRDFQVGPDEIRLGAALTLTEIERRLDGAVPAARRDVPAVRVAADPQRRHARRQPRHRLADRRRAARPARARGRAGPASVDGDRVVPLADYFTGYRQSVRAAGELIKEIRLPRPLAALTAFHKIAKRRFDDISSVAVGFAARRHRRCREPRVASGSAASLPPRSGRGTPRPRWSADRGTGETVEAAAG